MFILPEDKSSASYAGSQFGKSIADAFSESFPQGMQRGRLSSSLNQLQKGNGSPLQQLSTLYANGATDQQISTLLPFIQQQQANREAQNIANQGGISGQQQREGFQPQQQQQPPQQQRQQAPQGQNQPQVGQNQQPSIRANNGLVTKSQEHAALNPYVPKTPEQIDQEAAILQAKAPSLYPNKDAAEAKVRRDEAQREARNNIDKRTKEVLEAQNLSELWKEGTGQKLLQWKDEAAQDVANGDKTRLQAEQDATKKYKDFSDVRLNTEKELTKSFADRKQLDTFLKNNQKKYADFDALEIMKHDLIKAGGLSMAKASEYAYPLSDPVSKYFSSIKKVNRKPGLQEDNFTRGVEDLSRNQAYKISKLLTDEDSLLGIANKLYAKGLDPNAFMSEMKNLYDKGYLPNLAERQIKEFTSVAEIKPTWPDMWLDWGL
jgi:hypothetical protein